MYIDLVIAKHPVDTRVYLFYAPAWSHLKEGDEIVVDTQCGEQLAKVVYSISCEPLDEKYNFAVKALGATEPLTRVLKKVKYIGMDYSGDEYLNKINKEENDGTVND